MAKAAGAFVKGCHHWAEKQIFRMEVLKLKRNKQKVQNGRRNWQLDGQREEGQFMANGYGWFFRRTFRYDALFTPFLWVNYPPAGRTPPNYSWP
jgi:hypothetical protein